VPAAVAPVVPPVLAGCDPSTDLVVIFAKDANTNICCPKSGFECIGTNKATYCENGAPKTAAGGIDAACP
jgi:hypothetical protein